MFTIKRKNQWVCTDSGIHFVDTYNMATKLPYWKVNKVYDSIPKKERELCKIMEIEMSLSEKEYCEKKCDEKISKRINRFFESWAKYNSNNNCSMSFDSGIIQTYWKHLKTHERKIIMESYGVSDYEDFKKIMCNI